MEVIFKNFMLDFLYDVQRLKIVNPRKPNDMTRAVYDRLYKYKVFTRKGITSESLSERFEIIKKEYELRVGKIKLKDKKRFVQFVKKKYCIRVWKLIIFKNMRQEERRR